MSSLRQRLLTGTLIIVTLIWGGLAIGAWVETRHEAETLFDAHLVATAALLAELETSQHEHTSPDKPHATTRRVAFQIWQGGSLLVSSPGAPQQRLSQREGFSNTTIGDQQWRVFTRSTGERSIQVAEASKARQAVASEIAEHLLQPLLWALPILALGLTLLIGHTLRPLSQLADAIAQRSPRHLAPIPLNDLPAELQPVLAHLNELLARLESSMDSERRLTADAAHELRTPLAALQAHAQVAQQTQEADVRTAALGKVVAATERASHLVEQLLTLRRLDATTLEHPAPCDLHALAADILAAAVPQALAQSVELELHAQGPQTVLGDPVLLGILIRNLVDNAIRHGGAGQSVELCLSPDAGYLQLSVTDHGPGIPPAERAQALQRFARLTPERTAGAGLGLSIVARIAELHGARLALDDAPEGRGLQVTIIFPCRE